MAAADRGTALTRADALALARERWGETADAWRSPLTRRYADAECWVGHRAEAWSVGWGGNTFADACRAAGLLPTAEGERDA